MKAWLRACAVLAFLAPQAWAAEGDLPYRTSGLYLGVGAGYSQLELDQPPLEVSGGDFGYKLLAGYRLPRGFLPWGINVGLEAAWMDLGEITEDLPAGRLALESSGVTGYLVGFIPITRRIELLGKVGAYVWDAELSADGVTRDKSDGTDLAFGIGFGFNTGGQLGAQIEVESFDMLDGGLLASASITYQFK